MCTRVGPLVLVVVLSELLMYLAVKQETDVKCVYVMLTDYYMKKGRKNGPTEHMVRGNRIVLNPLVPDAHA